jgi:hypothetical protein
LGTATAPDAGTRTISATRLRHRQRCRHCRDKSKRQAQLLRHDQFLSNRNVPRSTGANRIHCGSDDWTPKTGVVSACATDRYSEVFRS